jgi:hypothetical protein
MRIYALLLGVLLTSAYGYAAQVAVSSVGPSSPAHRGANRPPATAAVTERATDRIWYGGVLNPIIVESGGAPAKTDAVNRSHWLDRPAARCFTPVS